jgi:hypothetical protein
VPVIAALEELATVFQGRIAGDDELHVVVNRLRLLDFRLHLFGFGLFDLSLLGSRFLVVCHVVFASFEKTWIKGRGGSEA